MWCTYYLFLGLTEGDPSDPKYSEIGVIFGYDAKALVTVGDIVSHEKSSKKTAENVTSVEDQHVPTKNKPRLPAVSVAPAEPVAIPVEPVTVPVEPAAVPAEPVVAPTWNYRIVDNNNDELRVRQLQSGLDEHLPEIILQRHAEPFILGDPPQFDTLRMEEVDVGEYRTPLNARKVYRSSPHAPNAYYHHHHRGDVQAPAPPLAFPAYTAAQPRYVSPPRQLVYTNHPVRGSNRPMIAPSEFYIPQPAAPSSRALQGRHQQLLRVPPVAQTIRHPISTSPPPQVANYPVPGTTCYYDYSEGAAGSSRSAQYRQT